MQNLLITRKIKTKEIYKQNQFQLRTLSDKEMITN